MSREGHWYEDHGELVAFARALVDTFEWDAATLIYFFEKPWKWTAEHARWVTLGRPAEVPDPIAEAAND